MLYRRYKLGTRLGGGAFSEVFLADDSSTGRKVALKIATNSDDYGDAVRTLFRIESHILLRLKGEPGVVPILAYHDHESEPFVVMEYLGRRSLNELRDLPKISLLRAFCNVCETVAPLHEKGLVHRDLKPENMFWTGSGSILIDFNYARFPGVQDYADTAAYPFGTAEFMSPEQTRDHCATVDRRSDIYSLGVSLYVLLARIYLQTPAYIYPFNFLSRHVGREMQEADCFNKHMDEKPMPLTQRVMTAPKILSDIILKAMEKDPDRRFQDALELGEEVKSAIRKISF